MSYAYEQANENEISLRSGHDEVINFLKKEMQERLSKAGIEVEETRITTLCYSSEIAGAMLKRQQTEAIVAAREKIVQGAVSIIANAIVSLRDNNIFTLSSEEKSRLVSNLLVVLCSEQNAQPVLSTSN